MTELLQMMEGAVDMDESNFLLTIHYFIVCEAHSDGATAMKGVFALINTFNFFSCSITSNIV
jgi:hypothetical protein